MSWALIKAEGLYVGIVAHHEKLQRIVISLNEHDVRCQVCEDNRVNLFSPLLKDLERHLIDYLSGERAHFPPYPLDVRFSAMAEKVFAEVYTIPYGEVRSYKWVAQRVGSRAYRAVGRILHTNPLPIIIPCHRVIRTDGGLGGFSPGIELKKKLLELEGVGNVPALVAQAKHGIINHRLSINKEFSL